MPLSRQEQLRWVDGELLQFRQPARPDSLTEGAHLGFLWSASEGTRGSSSSSSKRYLVLLKRVDLGGL